MALKQRDFAAVFSEGTVMTMSSWGGGGSYKSKTQKK
jgi:hypothetical protein